jgi:DNA-binding Xre family transcriptional regulator
VGEFDTAIVITPAHVAVLKNGLAAKRVGVSTLDAICRTGDCRQPGDVLRWIPGRGENDERRGRAGQPGSGQ